MNVRLEDHSVVSIRHKGESCRLVFHGLNNRSITILGEYSLTVNKLNKLYRALKGENLV